MIEGLVTASVSRALVCYEMVKGAEASDTANDIYWQVLQFLAHLLRVTLKDSCTISLLAPFEAITPVNAA